MGTRKEKIKVANVIMEGRYAGPQARIVSIAEKLKDYDIDTIVIFPRKDSTFFHKKLLSRGIRTNRLNLHHLTRKKSHLIGFVVFFIPEIFSLCKLFKKTQVDIIHCNASWQIKGLIAGKLVGVPVVWHLNDTKMPSFIKMIFNFIAMHFSDAFITAGKRVSSYYLNERKFSTKLNKEIQAPVDTSVLDPEKIKRTKTIETHGISIVTVGNVNPLKGIEYFIEMAFILNKQFGDLSFFVVGPQFDSQKKYLEKLYNLVKKLEIKNLIFFGPSEDIPSILKATDVYVCASIAEASPISVWEAMSMAKPIVTTNVGDVKRFVKNGENGFVVPIKDASALAVKVRLLIEREDLRVKYGRLARKTAHNYLDVKICAEKHAEFYKEIIAHKLI